MYAIVNIAGKQFKVTEGETIRVPRLWEDVGSKVAFEQVLLTDDGKTVKVGAPFVKGVTISTEVKEQGRDRTLLVYKKKRRKGYQRKQGHRQKYTLLEVKKIQVTAPKKKSAPKPKPDKAANDSEKGAK